MHLTWYLLWSNIYRTDGRDVIRFFETFVQACHLVLLLANRGVLKRKFIFKFSIDLKLIEKQCNWLAMMMMIIIIVNFANIRKSE